MRILWNALGFLAVLVLVLAAGLALLPADRLGKIVSDQLTEQTGRDVRLGETRVTLWPVLGVEVAGLHIANAGWAGPDPLFSAERASIGVDPLALLRGQVAVRSIEAAGPELRLSRAASGAVNWAPGAKGASERPGDPGLALVGLDRVRISRGLFVFDDAGERTVFADTDLTLDWPDRSGPMVLSARLRPGAAPVAVEARISTPLTLLEGRGAVPVTASLTTEGGAIGFDGLAGVAPEAQGRVTLDLQDTARAARALGQIGLDLPDGFGRRVTGALQLTLTRDGRIAIRDGALSLDDNAVQVAADIVPGPRPRVNAQIEAEALDLSGLVAGQETDQAAEGWSKVPIDASGLGAFDGEVALVTGALTVGDLRFGAVRSVMVLDDRRAVFDLRELRGYDGVMTGQFVANNRGGLSVRADIAFAGVELGALLRDAMGIGRISGKADGSIRLLGSGQNMHTLVATLDGDGALRAGPGRLTGIDLAAALTGQAGGGTTIFDQATGSFTITRGRLQSDDLLLELGRVRALGRGRVELAPRALDYLITVEDPAARDGRGLAVPVRLKGPWSDIQMRLDAGEAIDRNLSEERDALRGRVQDRVNQAVEDRLGVTVTEGESVEDALRKRLESEAVDGLRNLLNR